MALEKTTKHIILIVSALVLATTTAICIAKRDSIANFLKPKIKQESSIYTPSVDTSVSSSNETPEEKTVTLKEEENTDTPENTKIPLSIDPTDPTKKAEANNILKDLKECYSELLRIYISLKSRLGVKDSALDTMVETFDEMFPGWRDSSNKGKF